MGKLKARVESDNYKPAEGDKQLSVEFLFHMADISNPSKPWSICRKWTDLLFIEFFDQGDKERNMGIDISYLMDRTTTNIAKAQEGFINNLIKPAFKHLSVMLPHLQLNINYMDENIDNWATLIVQYSVMSHNDQLETLKTKNNGNKSKFDKDNSSNSDDSFVKDEIENDPSLKDAIRHLENYSNLNNILESGSLKDQVGFISV